MDIKDIFEKIDTVAATMQEGITIEQIRHLMGVPSGPVSRKVVEGAIESGIIHDPDYLPYSPFTKRRKRKAFFNKALVVRQIKDQWIKETGQKVGAA